MKGPPRATRRHGESHAPAAGGGSGGDQLVIGLPHPRVLRVIARSVLVTVAILAYPWLRSMFPPDGTCSLLSPHRWTDDPFLLPMLLRDLRREGLLVAGASGAALFLGNPGSRLAFVKQNKMHPVMSEASRMAVRDRSVDFVLAADDFCDASFVFVERILRVGGVTIVRLSSDPWHTFNFPANYRIVYIRRFGSTVVGIKKTSHAIAPKDANADEFMGIRTGRKLLTLPESKKMPNGLEDANAADFIGTRIGRKLLAVPESIIGVSNGLEDALLEPPSDRKASTRSTKRTRFLSDLLAGSLNDFSRRVFVDVGLPGRATSDKWFDKHYPKRNCEFEIIKLDVVGEVKHANVAGGIAGWLRKNLREEEYVVMKAEAEVREGATGLVDELFLECKNQWHKQGNGGRRAYRECLALYGRLRDEGIAVHQWWG
ncbi:hypothetical protein MUK42_04901 [Musa troglodytarum]|uniref:DUF7870 domain-containing protein n=1 Tax=Musa troglodytarum TaxID=320322 RepID=A0A9E7L3J0_9LILI|nr:hypothetical protein MUK42_04901 [Musa troglodytarum]